MFKFRSISDSYKIALAISVFFLINCLVSMNIESMPSFATYIIGFTVGIVCCFVGLSLRRRHEFTATDAQIEVALDLCKQLSAIDSRLLVCRLIFAPSS
ncbi:hypothetical protein [Rhodoferax antarcticus]|uniref:hypothetical protein n=1 Tax=Rhodoferax antarcticus TaxID=81479 RepID=UPI000A8D4C1F|nr:hypothetical protein [Rhodoferax antarcticus]